MGSLTNSIFDLINVWISIFSRYFFVSFGIGMGIFITLKIIDWFL
jgi:hypothetical protein